MLPITSIENLIECFDDAEPSEQASVLKRTDISVSDFEKYASWIKGGYSRNCITRRDSFEMILICWDEGAKTPIHDHDGQHCWVLQVSGPIVEKRFEINGPSPLLLQPVNRNSYDVFGFKFTTLNEPCGRLCGNFSIGGSI